MFSASSLASASNADKLLDLCDFGGATTSGAVHCGNMRKFAGKLKPTWNGGSGGLTRSSGGGGGRKEFGMMPGSAPG